MKLVDMQVKDFVDLMASSEPAPGGGSAAALEGALGAGLAAMVCAFTIGKKKYEQHQALAVAGEQKANQIKAQFADIIDRDTQAFHAVSAVFEMPKETDGEKAARKAAMEEALKGCCKTPMEMMELCLAALELIDTLMGKVNPNTASDLGVAILSLQSSIQGAWLNVLINVGGIKDAAFVEEYRSSGQKLLDKALPLADRLYRTILDSM